MTQIGRTLLLKNGMSRLASAVFYCFILVNPYFAIAQSYCSVGPASPLSTNLGTIILIGDSIDILYTPTCPGVIGLDNQSLVHYADLSQGTSYSITVTYSNCDPSGDFRYSSGTAYIDFNGDGNFTTNEAIGVMNNQMVTNAGFQQVYLFSVPINAVLDTVRLRVIQIEGYNPSPVLPLDPCAAYFAFGSVVDLGIIINEAQICQGMPNAGVTLSSKGTTCLNDSVDLFLLGSNYEIGQTFQWQVSNDGVNYTNLVGLDSNVARVQIVDTAWYRCEVTCSGLSNTSVPVVINSLGRYLSGVYTLNNNLPSSSTNFTSLSEFISALHDCVGVTGPVELHVAPGTYYGRHQINAWIGASQANLVTIKRDPNALGPVLFEYSTAGSMDNGIFNLNNVSHIKFEGVNFLNTGMNLNSIFVISNGSHHITFDQVIFDRTIAAAVYNPQNINVAISCGAISNLLVSNCEFNNGSGLNCTSTGLPPGLSDSIRVIGNTFNNVCGDGIRVVNVKYVEVVSNSINSLSHIQSNSGIYLHGSQSQWDQSIAIVNENTIFLPGHGSRTGILVYYFNTPQGRNRIVNNMIDLPNGSSDNVIGLEVRHVSNVDVFHNTVSINNGGINAGVAFRCSHWLILNYPFINIDIRNNIFVNKGQGLIADFGFPNTSYLANFSHLNKNIYFGNGYKFKFYTTFFPSLSDWQLFSGLDSASIYGDPELIGRGVLRLLNGLADNSGDTTVGVAIDIDGDVRPLSGSAIVDIGADEYNPPTCLPPTNVSFSNITGTSFDLSWTAASGNPTGYFIEYGPKDFTIGSGNSITTNDTSFTFIGLLESVTYDVYIGQVCAGDTSYTNGPFNVTTLQIPISQFPYFQGFENGSEGWAISNGINLNQWHIGDAVSYSGTSSAYISHNAGLNNIYVGTPTNQVVHMYRDFQLPTGFGFNYFSFWWRSMGSVSGAYMRVFIAPISFVPTSGVSISGSGSIPTGITQVGTTFANQPNWTKFNTTLSTLYNGQSFRLIFEWRNIGSSSINPPVAIDDIEITPSNCPILPTNVYTYVTNNALCIGGSTFLSLSYSNVTWAQQYKWQSSSDGINFTDISGATTTTLTTTPLSSIWYRCAISCSSQETFSIPIYVSVQGVPLNGVYTLNPNDSLSPTNFTSLAQFAEELSCGGITGPVTLNIAPGTYTGQVVFNSWSGGSENNMVTIQPDSNYVGLVTLVSSEGGYVVKLDGVSYLSIRDITITNLGINGSRNVLLFGSCSHISFNNITFSHAPGTPGQDLTAAIYKNNLGLSNLSVVSCIFIGAHGIYLGTSGGLVADSIKIIGNSFIDILSHAIEVFNVRNCEVSNNTIIGLPTTVNALGIQLSGLSSSSEVSRVVVRNNRIYLSSSLGCHGIILNYFNPPAGLRNEIDNNMVLISVLSNYSQGIRLNHMSKSNVYNNTISLQGGSHVFNNALYINQSTISNYFPPVDNDIRNNIISNSDNSGIVSITPAVMGNTQAFTNFNSNLYFGTGPNSSWTSFSNISSFLTWQQTTGFDSNSIFGNPLFVSATDLHISPSSPAIQAGDNWVSVPFDIDMEPRGCSVDIGADQASPAVFLNSSAPTPILSCGPYSFNNTIISQSGLYFQYDTVNLSCIDTIAIQLTIASPPVLTLPDSVFASCGQSSLALDAGAGMSSYLWSNGDTAQVIQATNSGFYSVTVTNSNGCYASKDVYAGLLSVGIIQSDTTVCSGQAVMLDAIASSGQPQIYYQWSTGSNATYISVTPLQTTTYSVTISDGILACVASVVVTVNNNSNAAITVSSCDPWLGPDGIVYPQSGQYTMQLTNSLGCDSTIYLTLTVLNFDPEICIITADSISGNYLQVSWEKPQNLSLVDSFLIYRESTTSGYQLVGQVHVDSLGVFHDYSTSPIGSVFTYKIAILDSCGNIRDLSNAHTSHFLQYVGFGNFSWSNYLIENGSNQVVQFKLYRDDLGNGNFQLIASLPGNVNSYTDVNYNQYPNASYRLAADFEDDIDCLIGGQSMITNSYSNIVHLNPSSVDEENSEQANFEIYPNPTSNFIKVIGNQAASRQSWFLELLDISGSVVFSTNTELENAQIIIDMQRMAGGTYFLKASSNLEVYYYKIIKNN